MAYEWIIPTEQNMQKLQLQARLKELYSSMQQPSQVTPQGQPQEGEQPEQEGPLAPGQFNPFTQTEVGTDGQRKWAGPGLHGDGFSMGVTNAFGRTGYGGQYEKEQALKKRLAGYQPMPGGALL